MRTNKALTYSGIMALLTEALLLWMVWTPEARTSEARSEPRKQDQSAHAPPPPPERVLQIDQMAIIGQQLSGGVAGLRSRVEGLPEVDVEVPPVRFGEADGASPSRRYSLNLSSVKTFGYRPAYYRRVADRNMVSFVEAAGAGELLVDFDTLSEEFSNRLMHDIDPRLAGQLREAHLLPEETDNSWNLVVMVPRWVERIITEVELTTLDILGVPAKQVSWIRLCFPADGKEGLPLPTEIATASGRRSVTTGEQQEVWDATLTRLGK